MKESLGEVHSTIHTSDKKGFRKLLAYLGPAYLVSVGYMDPGNWATDIAGGSQFGYKLIWVLLMSNLIALLLQSLSARLGIVKGLDLAQASRNMYGRWANFPLFVLAQIAIIACDLAEIIGMAIGLQLLFGLPLIWGISITILDTLLLLFLMNKGMRSMEGFIVSMVFIVGISFLAEMFIVEPQAAEVLQGFIPTKLSDDALYIAIGIIGATVMPHNLYLHSSLVQTRKIDRTQAGIRESIKFNFFDTTIALNLAFLVNASILILAASAFYRNGYHKVAEIQDAHQLLSSIFGSLAPALFAIALIAAGQSSTVTGTLAGQIIMEGHINLRIAPWLRRLLTRLLAIIPAFCAIIYFGDRALGELLVLSQVVLSLQLGFAVIPLIHFTSDKEQMGEFAIKLWVKILAWISAAVIIGLNVQLVMEEINSWLKASEHDWWVYVLIIPVVLAITLLLLYVFLQPIFRKRRNQHFNSIMGQVHPIQSVENLSYRRVGIPLEFSDRDSEVIRNSLLQGGKDAQYFLIHVVNSAAANYHGEKVMDLETLNDKSNLEKYRQNLLELGYSAEILIAYGDISRGISRLAKEHKLDLLVMAAHGHKGVKDIIYGSTLESVRHRVKIPVLIVR